MSFSTGGGGGSGSVSASDDVALNNVVDAQALVYNGSIDKWRNASVDKTAVGLANVDNTSDANKPISTATQTALDAKAASSHTHVATDIASGVLATARLGTGTADGTTFLRGDGTWAAPPGGGSATWGSVTGTLSDQTDLQGVLDAKAATTHTHTTTDITDFTEAAQDVIGSTLVAGTNVTLTYDDPANTLTIAATPGAGVTDLSVTATATDVTVISSTGDDAVLGAATGTDAGILSAADKTKLDGVATGATANSADATLLDRTNHTGSQAIATVTGLQTALDAKPTISSGAGAPASTPTKVGDIYIDTTGDDAYLAVGTASSADWEKTNDGAGSGTPAWGDITGTLSNQTDLQTALDGKSSTAHTHLLAAGATDVTASAAELNTLDGITATTTELNYTDGVTSAIQTQLDAKAASSHAHAIADTTGLQAALDAKAAASHTHARTDVTDIGLKVVAQATAPADTSVIWVKTS